MPTQLTSKYGIIGLSAMGLLLWWGVMALPRHIEEPRGADSSADTAEVMTHVVEMPVEVRFRMGRLRDAFVHAPSDSLALALASAYLDYSLLEGGSLDAIFVDSAVVYLGELAQFSATIEGLRVIDRTITLIQETQSHTQALAQLLPLGQDYVDALFAQKVSLQLLQEAQLVRAIWLTYTPEPMEGIRQIRELLEENPEYQMGLLAMAKLSFRSGQDKKAVAYLEKLLHINPQHVEGLLYLGNQYIKMPNQVQKGVDLLNKVQKISDNPVIQQLAEQYLTDLK